MKEQLYILFCESPFQTNKVDEDFEDQFISAKENGFETLLFNFEDLTSADRFSVATKRIKQNEELVNVIYRGWMLKPSKYEMLYNLSETITDLKRRYPIAFIILSQLNRSIDSPERNEDGKYGNYILESDLFGADALLQHADMVVGINRPGKQKIRFYGPDRYIIEDDKVLVMHFLKCRNGDNRMSFFKAEFEKMQIVEADTPPTQEKRTLTKIV